MEHELNQDGSHEDGEAYRTRMTTLGFERFATTNHKALPFFVRTVSPHPLSPIRSKMRRFSNVIFRLFGIYCGDDSFRYKRWD